MPKLLPAILAGAVLLTSVAQVSAVSPRQSDYIQHQFDCVGLLLSDLHAGQCGSFLGSASDPEPNIDVPATQPPDDDEDDEEDGGDGCGAMLLPAPGETLRVAVDCGSDRDLY